MAIFTIQGQGPSGLGDMLMNFQSVYVSLFTNAQFYSANVCPVNIPQFALKSITSFFLSTVPSPGYPIHVLLNVAHETKEFYLFLSLRTCFREGQAKVNINLILLLFNFKLCQYLLNSRFYLL